MSPAERADLLRLIDTDPVDWGETHFYIEDRADLLTGAELGPGPIVLADYQKRILRAALERDAAGRFRWQTVVYSTVKKSGKTRIAALVCAWIAATFGAYTEIYLAANDGKQSEDRLLGAIGKTLTLNPALSWHQTQSKVTLADGSFIEAIPIDPSGQAGANPTLVCFSEMWGYRLKHKERLWTELTISPARRGRSLRWVESYAGYVGESPTLENLYKLGVDPAEHPDGQGRRHPDFPDLPVYINEAAALFCYWDHQPRMPWQTPEYYAQEAAILTDTEYRRIHQNEWVTAEATFVPIEWWDACREDLPGLHPKTPAVMALDAAVSGDTFALVLVSRHPDPARHQTDVAVRYARIWKPPPGGQIDFAGPGGPEEEVKRLCATQNVVEVTYDPYQLHRTATEMRRARVANFQEFNQGTPRLVADTQLYQLIRDRRLAHSGQPDLTQHIQNANAKLDVDEEHKLRLVKGRGNIDAAVGLSMAAARCLYLNL